MYQLLSETHNTMILQSNSTLMDFFNILRHIKKKKEGSDSIFYLLFLVTYKNLHTEFQFVSDLPSVLCQIKLYKKLLFKYQFVSNLLSVLPHGKLLDVCFKENWFPFLASILKVELTLHATNFKSYFILYIYIYIYSTLI